MPPKFCSDISFRFYCPAQAFTAKRVSAVSDRMPSLCCALSTLRSLLKHSDYSTRTNVTPTPRQSKPAPWQQKNSAIENEKHQRNIRVFVRAALSNSIAKPRASAAQTSKRAVPDQHKNIAEKHQSSGKAEHSDNRTVQEQGQSKARKAPPHVGRPHPPRNRPKDRPRNGPENKKKTKMVSNDSTN